jgi:putative nucleotidyltransferase with HDIG domain
MKCSLPLVVAKTLEVLEKAGFEAYVVGGAVRDLLTDNPVADWDVTTNARPEEIQKIFPESFYDNQFGTVGITTEELAKQFGWPQVDYPAMGLEPEHVLEITTFRTEHGYSDRRRPDKVEWGKTLEEDLTRRDFTVNAMALQVAGSKKTGHITWSVKLEAKIVDPFNGQQDLKDRLMRAVGNPQQRFDEDALRMVRAIRFAAQLGFTIEEKTLQAISQNAPHLKHISQERIRDELFKILTSPYPADGIKLLFASGLLEYVLPELTPMRGVDQAGHHTKDVWNHSLDALAACPSPDPIVKLATLLHDVGKPVAYRKQDNKITFYGHEVVGGRIAKKVAVRLHLSKKQAELLWKLVRYHMFAYDPKMTDAAIRRFIRRIGREHINEMMMLRVGDRIGGGSKATSWRLRELQERIGQVLYTPMQIADLKVSGHDVMKTLKIKPGPRVGKILKQLFEEVLEDAAKNDRTHLLSRIKELGKEKEA